MESLPELISSETPAPARGLKVPLSSHARTKSLKNEPKSNASRSRRTKASWVHPHVIESNTKLGKMIIRLVPAVLVLGPKARLIPAQPDGLGSEWIQIKAL